MTTLGAMRTKIRCWRLDSEHSCQVGDDKKLIREETKKIMNCLNCTEMIRPSTDIPEGRRLGDVVDIHSNERLLR